MRRGWRAYLAWSFMAIAAIAAIVHVQSNYRSDGAARVSLWSTVLAIVFGAWSFLIRTDASNKERRGFNVIESPENRRSPRDSW
jgi:hypothetical protein